ncbi:hypothetical protein GCM10010401_04670 [Rarobacter faecitabidus]|uniref:Glutaredoxin-like protein DUF836 n=1 Tax=Rarobacter faecitabidus TaxID=13243 RepID=A0A542ZTU5_RARFA|nr:glutaredoxin family protein [Rarobacter faecitabidus]TQL63778.1 glutaredoxin-like protein DUF836 [Rarobacter faecitabidus]
MRVELFIRGACSLCPAAREVVERVCAELGEPWRETDLSGEFGVTDVAGSGARTSRALTEDELSAAREAWADSVPVVVVDGTPQGIWRVDEQRLAAAIKGPASGRRVLRA